MHVKSFHVVVKRRDYWPCIKSSARKELLGSFIVVLGGGSEWV